MRRDELNLTRTLNAAVEGHSHTLAGKGPKENVPSGSQTPNDRCLRQPAKMLFVSLGAVLVIILGVAAYYMWWHTVVLERISIAQLKIVEHTRSGLTIVHVSGWCLDDAYAIKRITATVEGSSINLLVYAFLVRSGTTGGMEYDVTIPPSVNELRFGKEKVVIWRRGGSGTTP